MLNLAVCSVKVAVGAADGKNTWLINCAREPLVPALYPLVYKSPNKVFDTTLSPLKGASFDEVTNPKSEICWELEIVPSGIWVCCMLPSSVAIEADNDVKSLSVA